MEPGRQSCICHTACANGKRKFSEALNNRSVVKISWIRFKKKLTAFIGANICWVWIGGMEHEAGKYETLVMNHCVWVTFWCLEAKSFIWGSWGHGLSSFCSHCFHPEGSGMKVKGEELRMEKCIAMRAFVGWTPNQNYRTSFWNFTLGFFSFQLMMMLGWTISQTWSKMLKI